MERRRDRSRKGHQEDVRLPREPMPKLDEKLDELEEVMDEDLREFMAADGLPCEADPGFRERLREKLWELLERNLRGAAASGKTSPGDGESGGD